MPIAQVPRASLPSGKTQVSGIWAQELYNMIGSKKVLVQAHGTEHMTRTRGFPTETSRQSKRSALSFANQRDNEMHEAVKQKDRVE